MRRPAAASVLAGVVLLALVAPLGAQSPAGDDRYTFFSVMAVADGVTAEFVIDGLLPVDEIVGLSSVTSETHLGVGRADALAALPDPGDLLLSLPGTLSGLTGVTGLPNYPAASRAEHPAVPEDEVVFVPDGGVGAGTLRTQATEDRSHASAAVADVVDLVGLLPSFSIGSIRTESATERLGGTSYRAVATSTISDLRLLDGLLRIDQITSEVTAEVVRGRFAAEATKIDVAGAEVAGTPVAIGEAGIAGLGQADALAPIVDQLVRPLVEQGIDIRTTPATETVEDGRAAVAGSTLTIEVPLEVQGRPGTFAVTIGRTSATVEASGAGGAAAGAPVAQPPVEGVPPPPSVAVGSSPSRVGSTPPASSTAGAAPGGSDDPGGTGSQLLAAAERAIPDWQVVGLYRAVVLGALLTFVAASTVRRVAAAGGRRSDLRSLWRW